MTLFWGLLIGSIVLMFIFDSEEEYDLSRFSDKEQSAIRMAQAFVKQEFASDCDFIDQEGKRILLEETEVTDRYKIIQLFESEEYSGVVKQEFIYKIYVQFFGGDIENINNWEYSLLQVERTYTQEKELIKRGNLTERYKAENTNISSSIDGISFLILERNEEVIRISTPKPLPTKDIKTIVKKLKEQYKTIYFTTDDKKEKREDYFSYIVNTIIEVVDGKENIISAEDWWKSN